LPLIGAVGAVLALVVLGNLWFGTGTVATAASDARGRSVADEAVSAVAAPQLLVYVSGSVQRPGLVTVESGARLADVIAAAGGALQTADLSRLNLAAGVRDAEHVHVPDVATERSGGSGPPSDDGIDINTADAATLEQLPGVGPVLAARIVAHRDENGPFGAIEDLLDVSGIGEAKLAQIREGVRSP